MYATAVKIADRYTNTAVNLGMHGANMYVDHVIVGCVITSYNERQ